jgi:class 3 adenylate cyclase
VKVSGIDMALGLQGADHVAAALDETVSAIQDACDEHGVTFLYIDSDIDGGKAVLVAGAPEGHHDDEARLLRGLDAIRSKALPFPVRYGLHRGRLFAVDIGSSQRRAYTVMGDTVNLAARLMARARPGQIVASEQAIATSRPGLAVEPLPLFRVKGREEPVSAAIVTGLTAPAESTAPPEFIGRLPELTSLRKAIASLREGTGSHVHITGDAGVGKTHLAREALRQSPGVRSFYVAHDERHLRIAYYAFREVLKHLLGGPPDGVPAETFWRDRIVAISPRLEPWVPLIGEVLDIPLRPTPESDALDPSFRRRCSPASSCPARAPCWP